MKNKMFIKGPQTIQRFFFIIILFENISKNLNFKFLLQNIKLKNTNKTKIIKHTTKNTKNSYKYLEFF